MYPWDIAPHSANGMSGVPPPLSAETSVATLIIPTWGPFPWVTVTL